MRGIISCIAHSRPLTSMQEDVAVSLSAGGAACHHAVEPIVCNGREMLEKLSQKIKRAKIRNGNTQRHTHTAPPSNS